jgi:CubicO group peptidase (beta-lactamase class C family)
MDPQKLAAIEQLVNADIADKKLPGAVVIVGHRGKIIYRRAFGNRSLVPTVEKMTVDTIFDVASLTKVVATTTSIMILIEQGKLRLNDTIGKFVPDIDDEQAKRVTIQQLLTHTSGYAPDFDLKEKWTGREGMLAALKKERLRTPSGTRFVYSDIGFIVLGEIVQRVTGRPLHEFVEKNVRQPLALSASGFGTDTETYRREGIHTLFLVANPDLIAPTENIRGQNSYLGSIYEGSVSDGARILRGQVHDPTSYRMGGVAGHAGLFSTADDLARYCQMLLNGGTVPNAERLMRNA